MASSTTRTDRGGPGRTPRRGPDHALLRLRSDGRQPARRQPHRAAGAAPLPGRRPPPGRPRRRGHRHGRRPERPLRGAQPARRRDARRQRRRHQGADGPHRRLRRRAGGAGRQPGLDRGRDACSTSCGTWASTSPSTRWWPGSRCKARMASEHGISYTEFSYMLLQAHDYLLAAPRPRRRAADRRLGPVGQHPVGRRPDPPGASGATVHGLSWPLLTAPDGTKLGQDHRRPHLARPGPHEPVPVLPALDADRRPPGGRVPGQVHPASVDEVDEVAAAHAEAPRAPRPASGAWPGRSPRWCTATRRPRRPRQASAVLFGGSPVDGARGRAARWWPGEVPTARLPSPAELDAGVDVVDAARVDRAGVVQERRPARARPGRGQRQRPKLSADDRWVPATCSTDGTCSCGRGSATTRCWSPTRSDACSRRPVTSGTGGKFASGAVHCGAASAAGEFPGHGPAEDLPEHGSQVDAHRATS